MGSGSRGGAIEQGGMGEWSLGRWSVMMGRGPVGGW